MDADIGDMILLAASCCVGPGAVEESGPVLDGLTWTSLIAIDREEVSVPAVNDGELYWESTTVGMLTPPVVDAAGG